MKKKISRKRRNPNTPTNKENLASYFVTTVKDVFKFTSDNIDKLERLSTEDLQELIHQAVNFESWIYHKLGYTRI